MNNCELTATEQNVRSSEEAQISSNSRLVSFFDSKKLFCIFWTLYVAIVPVQKYPNIKIKAEKKLVFKF